MKAALSFEITDIRKDTACDPGSLKLRSQHQQLGAAATSCFAQGRPSQASAATTSGRGFPASFDDYVHMCQHFASANGAASDSHASTSSPGRGGASPQLAQGAGSDGLGSVFVPIVYLGHVYAGITGEK